MGSTETAVFNQNIRSLLNLACAETKNARLLEKRKLINNVIYESPSYVMELIGPFLVSFKSEIYAERYDIFLNVESEQSKKIYKKIVDVDKKKDLLSYHQLLADCYNSQLSETNKKTVRDNVRAMLDICIKLNM